jgi:phosphotransferase system enzyme I (PtsP)
MNQAPASYEGSLLLTLEEISRLVSHSHDPGDTLANIVQLIQSRFHTAVCSVYLLEAGHGDLVLGATVGLKSDSVGHVRMKLSEGLTGLVGELMTPVNVANAFEHPRFKYFPEAGEDPYRSFLGVPLVEGGALQGVLVVQTMEPRTFSASEIRMLVTVAAQLAPLVGEAHLLEHIAAQDRQAGRPPDLGFTPLANPKGVGLSPGRGIGLAYVIDGFDEWRRTVPLRTENPAREVERLEAALARAKDEITRVNQRISELVGEDHAAILQAQLMIMQDRTIEHDLNACLDDGATAEGALLSTLDRYVTVFQKVTSPLFQERVYDIKDVFHRVLWQLRPRPGSGGERVVLVAREASVMELFAVELECLAGVVVEHGGPQSHAAILARSLAIPMVGQVPDFTALLQPGRRLLVDGNAGTVVLDPPTEEENIPAQSRSAEQPRDADIQKDIPGLPRLEVNISLLYEAARALHLGAPGVGLFRSEFLFLARRTLPTEEEQVGYYRKLLDRLAGRPVTIRTFDLRPDKLASYSHLGTAAARPLDWRLILESPPLQRLFLDQVRAILRAATKCSASILVPLVTRTEVLDFVLETVAKARDGLRREELAFSEKTPLGAMIETAAAGYQVGSWAPDVDFFALGTNDLTASALGLDREAPVAAHLSDPLHPGILRLIHEMITEAHAAQRRVSVCGDMAANEFGTVVLAAMQVDGLSVPVNQYTETRNTLLRLQGLDLNDLRSQILKRRSASEVRALLQETLRGREPVATPRPA